MNKLKIIYCCKDCGAKICLRTAFYGKGTCWSCSKITKNLSKITRLRRSRAGKGRVFSKTSRLKISLSKIGKKLSKEHRLKLSKNHCDFSGKNNPMFGVRLIGKNNPNWQNGISFLIYPNLFNDTLKLKIRKRDNFKCQYCKITEKEHFRALDVHHIDYNKFNCDEKNLITLCTVCNIKANYNRDYWYAYYSYLMENFN